MNCNGNVAPLVVEGNDNCNTLCSNTPINIICKKMVLSSNQQFLAVQNENNVSTKTFVLSTEVEGETLTDKTFYVETEDSTGNKIKTEITNLEIDDNFIKLNWTISKEVTTNPGKILIQMDAEDTDFEWKTVPQIFYIIESINASIK